LAFLALGQRARPLGRLGQRVISFMSKEEREWGADCGVGATALWIAYIRDREKSREKPAFDDDYATRFLRDGKGKEVAEAMARALFHSMFMNASGDDMHASLTLKYALPMFGRWHMQRMRGEPVPQELVEQAALENPLAKGVRIRTAYFDERIRKAFASGSTARQFVTLACGVDCRCLRLECLQRGVATWLVDQPAVISSFRKCLPELDERPDISTVAVKFGEELWWEKLLAHGFDPSLPSVFLIEGLVMYLSKAENEEIFRRVHSLMAPGSILLGDYVNRGFLDHPMVEPFVDELRKYNAPWTYGARSSATWGRTLSRCGFEVREDRPSVELKTCAMRIKFLLIDYIGTWVPSYRVYSAVKKRSSTEQERPKGEGSPAASA